MQSFYGLNSRSVSGVIRQKSDLKKASIKGEEKSILNFSIPADGGAKKLPDGKWESLTDWVSFVAYGKDAEIISAIPEGIAIHIEGPVKVEKYTDSSGNSKEIKRVIVSRFFIFERKHVDAEIKTEDKKSFPEAVISTAVDDEIPF